MSKKKMKNNSSNSAAEAIEKALDCLGKGFDIASDFKAKNCKGGDGKLLKLSQESAELVVPGFGSVNGVSVDIKCDKGDTIRFKSDILEFDQMSKLMNHRNAISGRIPSGLFNAVFGFNGNSWAQDACDTKYLGMDGYFISLFHLHIDRRPIALSDHIISAIPLTWDPFALARFIEKYGTHIVVGLRVGGQDVVYVRQDKSSNLTPTELKQHLDQLGDQLFTGACTFHPLNYKSIDNHRQKVPEAFKVFDPHPLHIEGFVSISCKDGLTVINSRRGGDTSVSSHYEWLLTVPSMPEAMGFTFVPITSLLKGVPGTGFLTHAINLYLRYKPSVSELQYFLDFQSHKMWAPVHNDLPLGPTSNRSIPTPSLHFSLMGPKLYVNTSQVIVGRQPVTGMRLHLEGKKNDRLAVHLQHLSHTPAFIGKDSLAENHPVWHGSESALEKHYEHVQWKMFSQVCTAPVEEDPQWLPSVSDTTSYIVTGAQLAITNQDSKSVLHLRLRFSLITNCITSQFKWEHCSCSTLRKSSFLAALSGNIEKERGQQQESPEFIIDSGVFHGRPPVPVQAKKLLKFVDTTETCKGPQDTPGYWLVTGAKLDVEKGKIGIHVKFSILTPV